MQPLDYLYLQMKLEGLTVNRNGWLATLPSGGEDLPLALLAQTADGQFFAGCRTALPPELHCQLASQATRLSFPDVEPLLQSLRTAGFQPDVEYFKTYVFPEPFVRAGSGAVKCLPKDAPAVKDFGFSDFEAQVYTVEDDGKILSACVSSRQNAECAEAWVFTRPEYRRQGLAQLVVIAWAQGLRAAGVIPFYSHKMENLASANLARALGLIPVFDEMVILESRRL